MHKDAANIPFSKMMPTFRNAFTLVKARSSEVWRENCVFLKARLHFGLMWHLLKSKRTLAKAKSYSARKSGMRPRSHKAYCVVVVCLSCVCIESTCIPEQIAALSISPSYQKEGGPDEAEESHHGLKVRCLKSPSIKEWLPRFMSAFYFEKCAHSCSCCGFDDKISM